MLTDKSRAQAVGGSLQRRRVVHCQEGVVVLVKAHTGALEFPFDEGVAIEPVGSVEGKETGHADDDRPQHLVPDIEVVGGKAAPLVRQDAVVRILGGKLGHGNAEGAALFHALEDEIDAIGPTLLHAP